MIVRSKIIIGTVLLFITTIVVAQNTKKQFAGKWKAPKGALIKVTILGNGFIGKTEKENAIVLKDVKFLDGKWQAIVLNPREKKIAKCELSVENNKLKIIAKKGIFYKIIYWTRPK